MADSNDRPTNFNTAEIMAEANRRARDAEARILDVLDNLSPTEVGRPVATKRLATELGIDYFALHYHMRKLESRGLVRRPQGQRSGWKVA